MQRHIRIVLLAIAAIAAVLPAIAQAPAEKPAFEVASIKLGTGKFQPTNFPLDVSDSVAYFGGANPHGRLTNDAPLVGYIQFAYKLWLSGQQMDALLAHVPKWVATENYAINAKAEG